ncbi:MAG: exopolyphosphatase [Pseudomonadales bacterium]|nr:exopolyphosphatase [Pseudomonadales bacterium]
MAELTYQLTDDQPQQLAAVDLGSNSFHMLVVQVSGGRVQILDKLKEMVRLAEGLDARDDLQEPVMQRALDCLERFGQRLRELPPRNVRVVGTNTLRRANNAADFIRRAEAALGHTVEIIPGREEARLIYLGVSHALEDDHDRRLVIDIGGGSTELILGRRFKPELMESLFMGCVGVSRTYFADGRIRSAQFQEAVNHARQELEPIERAYSERGWDTVVGASGTILATQEVLRAMGLEQSHITLAGLEEIRRAILAAKSLDSLSLPGLPAERAAVFPGGIAILYAIFDRLGIDRMQASSGALREGVIHDLLGRAQHQDVRESTVRDLMARYHVDDKHARRVRETALGLLAQVADAWQLTDPNERLLLSWAAELHEIGMDIAHTQYHKHGGYLLQHMDMPGFSSWDQQQMAALVRAHRRKFPIAEPMFNGADSTRMIRLAVLLRLATVLHRNRVSRPLPHAAFKVLGRNQLCLTLPESWLRRHPLTRLDLQQEAAYLTAADVELLISNC